MSKVQHLSFCLIFCQFQPGAACKSVAYKKVGKLCTQKSCVKFGIALHTVLEMTSVQVRKTSDLQTAETALQKMF